MFGKTRAMPRIASYVFVALLLAAPAYAEQCGEGDVGDIDTSCAGLWRERNRVLAKAGYCFTTQRAIAAFGRGCFPPYGKLGHDDKCYVQALQKMERAAGCR